MTFFPNPTPLKHGSALPNKIYHKRAGALAKQVPHLLIDTMIQCMQLNNDAALSRLLGFAAPVISKIRHRKIPVGSGVLLNMHETTGIPIAELKTLLAASD